MRVKINLQIFLIIIILFLTRQIQIYTYLMIFAFIHEMGHILVGILLKLKVKLIQINPFGISVSFEDYGYKKLLEVKRIIIYLAGPVTNLFIAFTFFYLINNANINLLNISSETRQMIIYSNLFLGIFNLVPIFPLDGGRILRSLLKLRYSTYKTDKLINIISNIQISIITAISSILILYYKNIGILLGVIYLWVIVLKENKKFTQKEKLYDIINKEFEKENKKTKKSEGNKWKVKKV